MIKFFKKIYNKILYTIRVIFISIMITLSNIEVQMFKSLGGKTKIGSGAITKMLFRNTLLEKLFQGKHDEKYVQRFYEILRKADEFMRKSTPHKLAVSADTYAKTLGKEDKYGRKYDHFGFFDETHKYYGKTLEEAYQLELEERRTKDDKYELIDVINNKPIDVGLSKIGDVIEEIKDSNGRIKYVVNDLHQKSKQLKFPIQIVRDDDKCINKIEHLSEFLHIKRKPFEYRRFEFFIPLKYKTHKYDINHKIIKDIINIKEIYTRDKYNELTGYGINSFINRFIHNDMYDVFRFDGFEMKKISTI